MNRIVLRAQQRDLLGLGLLDLQHQVGLPEDAAASGTRRAPCAAKCGVRDRAALAGAGLDQDLVAVLGSSRAPAGVSATRYSSGLISVGTPTFTPPRPSSTVTSKRAPRPLQLGEQVLGLDAALGRERAARLDPAPRQQPHGGGGRRTGRDDPAAEPPLGDRLGHGAHPDPCPPAEGVDDVHRDGARRRGRGRPRRRPRSRSGGADASSRTRSSTAGASERRKLASRQPKLSGNVRSSE